MGAFPGRAAALVSAMALGVVLSYLLAWLTLRSGSVLPAVVCVALGQIFASMEEVERTPPPGWPSWRVMEAAVWLVLAVVLWRYWGIEEEDAQTNGRPQTA